MSTGTHRLLSLKLSWALYDFGNSAFATLVVTFVYATYFTQFIAADAVLGTTQWSWGIAVSALAIAILSPLCGVVADRGYRWHCLMGCTLVCCLGTAMLTLVAPGMAHAVWIALGLFAIANIAFELGNVCYNAYLPLLAPDGVGIGSISGLAWGCGYAGGLLCLMLALILLIGDKPWFGLPADDELRYRLTNLLVVAWFLLSSIPLLALAPRQPPPLAAAHTAGAAWYGLRQALARVLRYKDMKRLLYARLLYNDGLITLFAFGGIYAAGTFGMSLAEVLQFGIVINLCAGIGVCLFGYIDDRIGGKRTVMLTLVGLVICTLLAAWAPSAGWLWVAGIAIGLCVGPNQSASRTLMARFAPAQHRTECFGFFALSGKITAFMGPLLLGAVTLISGSQRAGVLTLLLFFIAGALVLLTVNEARGVEQATSDPTPVKRLGWSRQHPIPHQ